MGNHLAVEWMSESHEDDDPDQCASAFKPAGLLGSRASSVLAIRLGVWPRLVRVLRAAAAVHRDPTSAQFSVACSRVAFTGSLSTTGETAAMIGDHNG